MNEALPMPVVRHLGRVAYAPTWAAMREFTNRREAGTSDEYWVLEHDSVYTQGLAGKPEHLLAPGDVPVVKTDRGGQVTWHGPGQLVVYLLIDLRRLGIGPRELVRRIETAVIDVLALAGLVGERRAGAPGVYVDEAKIAALGLRIRDGCSYHGVSLNVDCELAAFQGINPCGYQGLKVTSLAGQGCRWSLDDAASALLAALLRKFNGDPAACPSIRTPQAS